MPNKQEKYQLTELDYYRERELKKALSEIKASTNPIKKVWSLSKPQVMSAIRNSGYKLIPETSTKAGFLQVEKAPHLRKKGKIKLPMGVKGKFPQVPKIDFGDDDDDDN